MELVEKAKQFAVKHHQETNHRYNDHPYDYHLNMVYEYGLKYIALLPDHLKESCLSACWTHDLIEDCRVTYSDIKNELGEEVAEITYALTNEKGRNRREQANDKYYEGIRNTHGATFVKLCDRLANVAYSKKTNSSKLQMYKKDEVNFFFKMGNIEAFRIMYEDLYELLNQDTK